MGWEHFVLEHFGDTVSGENRRRVVLTLMLKGVSDLEGLAFMTEEDLAGWNMNEVVKVIVHKAKVVAIGVVEAAERERIRRICEAEGVQLKKEKVKAAEALADDMEPEMVALKEQSLKRKAQNAGMSGLGKDLGPGPGTLQKEAGNGT